MKRVFMVHAWSGKPNQHWFPWLGSELERLGFKVFIPEMSHGDEPVIEKWVGELKEIVKEVDEDTYFIGHSIGCQTIIRFLEGVNKKAGGALFVSGWFKLANLESEEEEKIARPWMEYDVDLVKVKKNLLKSVLIISDNDPYNCFEENKKKFSQLGSKIVVLGAAGHITEEDGYRELPEALKEFKNL